MSDFIIKVKSEELVGKAGTVKTKVSMMQAAINEAATLLSNTSSYWIGDAGDKKRRDFLKRKKEADQVIKRLSEYPDDLLKMAGIYVEAETQNTDRSSGLPNNFII